MLQKRTGIERLRREHAASIDFASGDHLGRHRHRRPDRIARRIEAVLAEGLLMVHRLPEHPARLRAVLHPADRDRKARRAVRLPRPGLRIWHERGEHISGRDLHGLAGRLHLDLDRMSVVQAETLEHAEGMGEVLRDRDLEIHRLETFADEQRERVRLLMVHIEDGEWADGLWEFEELLALE